MRLFLALDFEEAVKDELENACGRLRRMCVSGNFTRRENLHLTLVFLGETAPERLPELRRILEGTDSAAFPVDFSRMGRFPRRGGDIYFAAARKSPELSALYQSLSGRLRRAGYTVEEREYVPHLTLAREAVLLDEILPRDAERIPVNIHARAGEVALMRSDRIRGRLVYSKIFVKQLKG